MASRKENFWAYYKANPDKLKGKSIDEAYAAMRRNAGATNLTNRDEGGNRRSAIDRRLARARGLSAENKPKAPWKPLTVGEGAAWLGKRLNNNDSIKDDAKKVYRAADNFGKSVNSGIKSAYAATPAAKRKAAIERRRKSGLQA